MARLSALYNVAGLIWLPVLAVAQPIGPHHEAEIPRLVAPLQLGAEVVPGVRLSGVAVGAQSLDWQLQAPGATATVHCVLRAAGATVAPPSWTVSVQPDPPPPALAAAVALLGQRIAANDQGQWHALLTGTESTVRVAAVQRQEQPGVRDWATVRLAETAWVWAAALLLLGWTVSSAIRRAPTPLRTAGDQLGLALGIGTAAWLARNALPLALLHCNNHGIEDARMVTSDTVLDHAALLARYGPAWLGPHWLATWLLGGTDLAMAAVASAAGCAAAVVTAWAALVRWGRAAGWAAGLAMALLPVAVRVGNSESSFGFGQLAAALALFGASTAAAGGRAHGMALTTAGLWLVATGHTFGPGFAGALVVLLAPELLGTADNWRRVRPLALLAMLPIAAFLPLILGADPSNRGKLAAATLAEASPFKPLQHVLWLDAVWTPWPIVAVLALGLALASAEPQALRTRLAWMGARATGLWMLLGTAMFIGGSLSVGLRYQALLAPVVAWLVGAAFVRRPDAPAWSRAAGGLALASGLAVVLWTAPLVGWADSEALSYRTVVEAVPLLPDRAWIVLPRRERQAGLEVVIDFPEFVAKRHGRHLRTVYADELPRLGAEHQIPPDVALYAWRGPHCQAYPRVVGKPPTDRDTEGLAVATRCRELAQLCPAPVVAQGQLTQQPESPNALPAEFHQFVPDRVRWSLVGPCGTLADSPARPEPPPPR